MPARRLTALLNTYLRSVWIPAFFLILCCFLPVSATSYATRLLAEHKDAPSALLEGFVTVLLYGALVPVTISSFGLLIAGVYQALNGLLFKGLINLSASIALNLGILALFFYGFIALP